MNKVESIIDFKADRKTIQKSAINSVIIQLIFKLKGIITMPIMTYYLAPKEMGIFNIISVTASLLTPLFLMNLADGPVVYLVQEKSKERVKSMYNTVFNSSFLFFTFYSIVFFILVRQISASNNNYLYLVIPVIFSNILYKLFSYVFAVFQKTTIIVKNTLFRDTFGTLLTILLVILGLSYRGIIYALVISNIVAGIYVYRLAKRELPLRFQIDKEILLKFLKISLPLLPVFLFSWVIHSSDSYFLLWYKGGGYVGKYSVIYGLSNIILVLTWALNFFWFPFSAKLWIEDREKYRKFFVMIFTIFAIGLMTGVLFFELNSKIIMQIFARRAEYQDGYVIMGIITFAFANQVLLTLLTAPLYSNKNTTQIFISYFIGGLTNCGLNFLLIPSQGILGAAISTAISYLLVVLLMSIFNYTFAKFAFLDKRLLYIPLLFSPLWVSIIFVREHLEMYQLLFANIILLLMIGTLIYFKILTEEGKKYFQQVINEFKSKSALKK